MSENMIGVQIKKLRKKMGWSQTFLGDKIGVSKQTISNWENGLKSPRMGALQQLSDLFHVSIGTITDGEPEPNTKRNDIAKMIDNNEYMSFQGRELSDEDKEILKRIFTKD